MAVITLTTDFGTRDTYVAEMKGAILSITRDVHLVDITHEVTPHHVLEGALTLEAAAPRFPAATIHVGVVDPGVGTARRGLAVASRDQMFVGPDNGLFTPFLDDRGAFVRDVVKPLQQRVETVYVQRGTDAEEYVPKRFPHKRVKHVGNVLRPTTIRGFIAGAPHAFQPGRANGVDAVYHFQFTGDEPAECTVTIRDAKIEVRDGLIGECALRVTASSRAWLRFLRKEARIAWLLVTRQVRLKGNPELLLAFARCFPA